MTVPDFDKQVETLWATHFGCSVKDFGREGTTLLPVDRMQGDKLIHIVYVRKRALAEIDPDLRTDIDRTLAELGGSAVLSSELLQRAWGGSRLAEVDAGLIFHLRPGQLVRPELDAQFVLRRLTKDDQQALDSLRQHCTPGDVDEAYVEIEHELAWGCFKDAQLAAVGSAYRRNGFMDYGVLTDPEFRGHGLARHVVCGLTDDTLERGLIPQYRCNRVNQASRRVAEAAGFTVYFTTEGMQVNSG
jgi:GNAT superfamily N-acetyltransferase